MCAKPEPAEVLPRLLEVTGTLDRPWQYGWVGIQTLYGFLENV